MLPAARHSQKTRLDPGVPSFQHRVVRRRCDGFDWLRQHAGNMRIGECCFKRVDRRAQSARCFCVCRHGVRQGEAGHPVALHAQAARQIDGLAAALYRIGDVAGRGHAEDGKTGDQGQRTAQFEQQRVLQDAAFFLHAPPFVWNVCACRAHNMSQDFDLSDNLVFMSAEKKVYPQRITITRS